MGFHLHFMARMTVETSSPPYTHTNQTRLIINQQPRSFDCIIPLLAKQVFHPPIFNLQDPTLEWRPGNT